MKKYFDKYKRKFILYFYIPNRHILKQVRLLKRQNRLLEIRERKAIYDLTDMD